DNTSNNPHNPNNPPLDIFHGPKLSQEMGQVHFWLTDYQPGDEDIIMDSAFYFTYTSSNTIVNEHLSSVTLFPNPAVHSITVKYAGGNNRDVQFNIFNPLGELLFTT